MSVVIITISDREGGGVDLEGRLDDFESVNKPPTPALIIGSFLAAHPERLIEASIVWYREEMKGSA